MKRMFTLHLLKHSCSIAVLNGFLQAGRSARHEAGDTRIIMSSGMCFSSVKNLLYDKRNRSAAFSHPTSACTPLLFSCLQSRFPWQRWLVIVSLRNKLYFSFLQAASSLEITISSLFWCSWQAPSTTALLFDKRRGEGRCMECICVVGSEAHT